MSPELLCPPACMQLLLPNQEITGRMHVYFLICFCFPSHKQPDQVGERFLDLACLYDQRAARGLHCP
jgi:hypothetical protein